MKSLQSQMMNWVGKILLVVLNKSRKSLNTAESYAIMLKKYEVISYSHQLIRQYGQYFYAIVLLHCNKANEAKCSRHIFPNKHQGVELWESQPI